MFWTAGYQLLKQRNTTLFSGHIPFLIPKPNGSIPHVIDLFRELTLWTAENFHDLYSGLWAYAWLSGDILKFLSELFDKGIECLLAVVDLMVKVMS